MTDFDEPRAGCPGGAVGLHAGMLRMSSRLHSPSIPVRQRHGDKMPATTSLHSSGASQAPIVLDDEPRLPAEPGYRVIRRNGAVTPFDATKITVALTKAFLAVEGSTAAGSRRVHDLVEELTEQVVSALTRRVGEGRTFHIEDVQDQVELALMRGEHHKVARAYVLYREERARDLHAVVLAVAPVLDRGDGQGATGQRRHPLDVRQSVARRPHQGFRAGGRFLPSQPSGRQISARLCRLRRHADDVDAALEIEA